MYLLPFLSLGIAALGLSFALVLAPLRAAIALCVVLALTLTVMSVASSDFRQAAFLISPFVLPFAVAAAAMGIASGALLRRRQWAWAIVPVLPLVYFLWSTDSKERDAAAVLAGSREFVTSHARVEADSGAARAVSSTQNAEGQVVRVEYSIGRSPATYALVDVVREHGAVTYRIACFTTVPLGHRQVRGDVCSQSPAALPAAR